MTDAEKIRNFLLKRAVPACRAAPARRVAVRKPALRRDTKSFGRQLDSFGVLELVAFLEEEFDVSLKRADLKPKNFGTIGAILKLLDSRKRAKKKRTP